MAPTRMMPWMALAPDISGVCSVEDTLEMTSMPTNAASTKIVSQVIASLMITNLRLVRCDLCRRYRIGRLAPARVRHAHADHDLVGEVGVEHPLPRHQEHDVED